MNRIISIFFSLLLILFPVLASAQQDIQVTDNTGNLSAITDQEFLNQLKTTDDEAIESVIVYLKKPTDWSPELQKMSKKDSAHKINALQSIASKAHQAQDAFLATYSVKQSEKFWLGNAISLKISAKKVKQMANDPRVDQIVKDSIVQIPDLEKQVNMIDSNSDENTALKTYDWGIDKIGANKVWELLGMTGKNIKVAVIDTGIQGDHPDLEGKVVAWRDFIHSEKTAYDDDGHGTHVAGTIAGNGTEGIHTGVAPGVQLIGAKVLDNEGKGTYTTVLSGMQWAAENEADILNLSLGGPQTDAFNTIFEDLNSLGIFPVIAAGNSGPDPSTIGSPGSHPLAFTIGATDLDDNIAAFSSRGPVQTVDGNLIVKPDVVAPGVDIVSTWYKGGYARMSGTSMATPYTAGAVALLKEAFPGATLTDLKGLLTQNSVPLGKSQPNSDYGWGRIDIYNTILSGFQNGTLTGQVIDSDSKTPLMGAKVAILEKNIEITTDPYGHFSISLPAGTYTIKVSSYMYDSYEDQVTIADKQTTPLNIELNPQPAGSISGTVVDVRNQPIPSVKVDLHTSDMTLVAYSDKNGQFYFERVPEGEWSIHAESYRIAPINTKIHVKENETSDLKLATYRKIAAETMLGYYRSNHIPLDHSTDGKLVVAGTTADVNEDGEPNLFAFSDSGQYLWTAKLGDRVNQLAVSGDGSLIAAAYIGASFGTFEENDFKIEKGDPDEILPPAPWSSPVEVTKGDGISILNRNGKILSTVPVADFSGYFAISKKSDLILYAGKSLYVWDKNGALVNKTDLEAPSYGISISGDGKTAAVALMNGKLLTYDIEGTTLTPHKDIVVTDKGWPWSVSMNHDGSLIVVGEYSEHKNAVGHIRGYSKNGELKWTVETGWHVDKTDMSDDGSIVAAGSWDGKLYVINGKTGQLLFTQTPGRPDNTLMDAKVKVKVSPNGERIAASFVRANLVNVYSSKGEELSSHFSFIHPVALTGFENLTRLITAGPTILADGLTGPSEIAYLDTPDAVYVDTNRAINEKKLTNEGTLRYGDYGWNYYLDVDYLKRANKVRWISQAPVDVNAEILPQSSGYIPVATINKGRVKFKFNHHGDPIFLSEKENKQSYLLNIDSVFTPWWLYLNSGLKNEERGIFTIKRY